MKITQIKGKGKSLKNIELSVVMDTMKAGGYSRAVNELRALLSASISGNSNIHAINIPILVFPALFRKNDNGIEFQSYNGLVLVVVNNLADGEEVAKIKKLAAMAPQTLAAFAGSSGKSVKILVPFALPDRSLPQNKELAELFHATAYRKAVAYYQAQLQCDIAIRKSSLEQGCRYSFDPDLYYNPSAVPLMMEQPMQMPDELTYREAVSKEEDPLLRLMPGYDRSRIISHLYNACMQDALEKNEFRRNMLAGEVEYRARGSYYIHFAPVSETVLNSIGLNAQAEGLPLWDRDVKRYVYSDRAPVYYPLEDYLDNLPAWDGKDHIRALADTLPTENSEWHFISGS